MTVAILPYRWTPPFQWFSRFPSWSTGGSLRWGWSIFPSTEKKTCHAAARGDPSWWWLRTSSPAKNEISTFNFSTLFKIFSLFGNCWGSPIGLMVNVKTHYPSCLVVGLNQRKHQKVDEDHKMRKRPKIIE